MYFRLTGSEFPSLPKLQQLFIRETPELNHVAPNALSQFGSTLKLLDISGNGITEIEDDAFKDLLYISSISIKSNELRTASPNWFKGRC